MVDPDLSQLIQLPRRAAILVALALAAPSLARAQCAPPQVLFVCPFGTVKSAIAREALKRRAAAAGLDVRVASRGVDVQDHVSAKLAAALKADHLDPAGEPAMKLTSGDLKAGQIVVVFDEAAQDPRLSNARVWSVPSWNDDYAAAKAALDAQLAQLVDELRRDAALGCGKAR